MGHILILSGLESDCRWGTGFGLSRDMYVVGGAAIASTGRPASSSKRYSAPNGGNFARSVATHIRRQSELDRVGDERHQRSRVPYL